jgi:hypothetical protein
MIYINDNFLPDNDFNYLQDYCEALDFNIINAGGKDFSVLATPERILPYLHIEGHKLILTFIRNATNEIDTDLRIHADNIIQGEKTALAVVLYINQESGVTENGTRFYKHIHYGKELPKNISDEDFDNLLQNDSNDITKWLGLDIVYNQPNRLLMYNSNYFHAKFPSKIKSNERIVLVAFYSEI